MSTVIVGAGQAGLVTAYHLGRLGQPAVVLDARDRVGDSWRERYDSLRLFSPGMADGLPGLPFPGPRHEFPTARLMGDYLEQYAAAMELPVRTGVRVERVSRRGGGFTVETSQGELDADDVVIATGGHTRPYVPDLARDLDPVILQLHSTGYRNPSQLQAGPVLVVGASHSGADLALEAAAEHETSLAGKIHGQIPVGNGGPGSVVADHVIMFAAMHVLTLRTPVGRRLAQRFRHHGAPLERPKKADLERAGVVLLPHRVTGTRDGLPVLDDGRVLDVRNVLWCTGFREDWSWIEGLPLAEDGYPRQQRGVVDDVEGLYFMGLPFQYAAASGLVLGASRDGRYVAEHIAARRGAQVSAGAAAT
ncbi:NAD(P)-binding domain-containing protein [Georgenia sp. M64]|uniref:flavin-containing monooxygenase n=1 Tax=Georgenia sp. M64 TaxID=3120520 RepID=UPI0030DFE095